MKLGVAAPSRLFFLRAGLPPDPDPEPEPGPEFKSTIALDDALECAAKNPPKPRTPPNILDRSFSFPVPLTFVPAPGKVFDDEDEVLGIPPTDDVQGMAETETPSNFAALAPVLC